MSSAQDIDIMTPAIIPEADVVDNSLFSRTSCGCTRCARLHGTTMARGPV